MAIFELSAFDKIELANCDPDIRLKFKQAGGGYHQLLPTLIQLNRNLSKLNEVLTLLARNTEEPCCESDLKPTKEIIGQSNGQ